MTRLDVPIDVLEAIDRVVQYNWDDEQADFEVEKPENPESHIFTDLTRVNEWLRTVFPG